MIRIFTPKALLALVWKAHGDGSWRRGAGAVLATVFAVLAVSGCSPTLPEPDSPGARLYKERCDSCHRLFAPSTLKFEMWKVQVDRMQGEMARRGVPPLTTEERATVLDYLKRHSG